MQRDHANSANIKKNKACKRWRETDLETKKLQWRWKRDCCSVCVRPSPSVLNLRLLLASFFPLRLRHSLYWFLHFLLLFLQIFICRKMEQISVFFLSLFFCFLCSFFLFFLCLTVKQECKKETPSVFYIFFTLWLSCVFLVFLLLSPSR